MNKTVARDTERAARVIKVARITGVSERHVRHVLGADRENEVVLTTYMNLQEQEAELENKLLAAVKNLVPFN